MERVKFTIPGEPCGKGRPRFIKDSGRAYTPGKTALYENLVRLEYQTQCGGAKFQDGEMLDMRIQAYYRIPQSKSKKQKAMMEAGVIRPTKKPDMDNIVKVVADSLNNLAYSDDTQIVDCQVRKFYSHDPRVVVIIQRIGGDDG